MSNAITMPTTTEKLERLYDNMVRAYNLFEAEDDKEKKASFKLYYQTQLNIYRDVCTEVVERLMQTNPRVLEDIQIPYV